MPGTKRTGAHGNLSRFSLYIWLTFVMFVVFAATFVLYVQAERQLDQANNARLQSYLLADELRQSSDDLTHAVRSYVVTGEASYKRRYHEILDIRDGRRPRPVAYHDIYWDLVLADDRRPRAMGQAIALLELMRQAGFTEEEFAKLAEAKASSDELTRVEFAAMERVETTVPPTQAHRAEAVLMLFDLAYHDAKARIMRPIREFREIADQRTLAAVEDAEARATLKRIAFVVFGLLLVSLLWGARRNRHAALGCEVDELHARIVDLGSGDFAAPIPVAKGMRDSVLGWLSETQVNLARLDAERGKAEDESARRENEALQKNELSEFLQSCMSAREAGPVLERYLPRLFPGAAGALYFSDGTNEQLRRECAWNGTRAPQAILASHCWGLRRGKAYLSEESDPRCPHSAKDGSGVTMCVPLVAHSESIGLLCLEYAGHELAAGARQQRADFAAAVAWHVGLALSNLRLRDTLREQSLEDSLTGLFNRRYLNTTLPREIGRAARIGAGIAVFMLDIDHFKRFNDVHGHDGGDAVLVAFSELLKESCRQDDLACRYGGEEFTVVLFGADAPKAREWAQRLAAGIRAMEVQADGVALPAFTVSMGLALYPAHGADADTLLQAADRALYEAKRAGRDRLVISGDFGPAPVATAVRADVIELKAVPTHKK